MITLNESRRDDLLLPYVEILKSKVPYKLGNIIADGLFIVRVNGDVKMIITLVKKQNTSYYRRNNGK